MLNLGMSCAIIINSSTATSLLAEIKNIKKLELEDFYTSGVIIFFDKYDEVICFGSSYEDVLELAHDLTPPHAKGYYIIKDVKEPLDEAEIDNIYDALLEEKISIFLIQEQEPIKVIICQN
jgi:hypothetical protein